MHEKNKLDTCFSVAADRRVFVAYFQDYEYLFSVRHVTWSTCSWPFLRINNALYRSLQ